MPIPAFGFHDNDASVPASSATMESLVQWIARYTLSPLTPTAIKTANYSVVAFDLAQFNTTSGTLTANLPAVPLDKTRVGVKLTHGANPLLIQCLNTDVFDSVGGPTTLTLTNINEYVELQYAAAGGAQVTGVWEVLGHTGSVLNRNQAIAVALALGS